MIVRGGDEKGEEHPCCMEQRIMSLLGRNYIELPLKNDPLKDVLSGRIVCNTRLHEVQGGAVFYNEIDRLGSSQYSGHLILIGFDENSDSYNALKSKLEELASKNPDGIKRTLEDFNQGISIEQLEGLANAIKENKLPYDPNKVSAQPADSV